MRRCRPGLVQVALEHRERGGVVLELVVGLADVVEHARVGRDLEGALELDQRAAIVGLVVQRDAATEV
jgi:hypothetical protein